jgi:zinc/manganese transport system substrate-binding protein
MHKRGVWIATLLLLAVFASAQKIVVSFPAYDIVLKEAFPNADVILLTKGVSDPHEYQLTPQDLQMLKALTERDVIISSMHAPFELKIAEMAKNGEIKAKLIDLTKIQWYLTWDGELVKGAEHDHGEHDHGKHDHGAHKHDHGGLNLHDHGVFPPNVFILIEEVSKATGLKPDQNFIQKLKQLNATYANKFSGKAIAITPDGPVHIVLARLQRHHALHQRARRAAFAGRPRKSTSIRQRRRAGPRGRDPRRGPQNSRQL